MSLPYDATLARFFEDHFMRTRATNCPGGHAAPTSLPRPTAVERGRGS